jgi:hypothetical protein
MVWPWGGHNNDVATVAMMERPLGPVKVTLQEKKTMTMKSYKLFTVKCMLYLAIAVLFSQREHSDMFAVAVLALSAMFTL